LGADEPAVDPDRARVDALREPHRARYVLAVDAGDQAVAEPVGQRHGLILGLEIEGDRDRAEDLLTRNRVIRCDLIEDRGRHEIAAVEILRPSAPEAQPRALGLAFREVPGDLLVL